MVQVSFQVSFQQGRLIQAAVTLRTDCSLGPEGPHVDIGKACDNGCSLMMENNKERTIALIASGSAAGIASGFNATVAGSFFFDIEIVLRPLSAENSPPVTTAMIILHYVISSTISNAVLREKQAFTVPAYVLKSAAGILS
ncbi:Chloride channel, core [Artemisia annua]|uniref:Chloride channel, core n=1 Tax=Artemisia annua TaxID=35608 RepID=A0A2U1MHX5_ARTAN|nr:Chloride channel, core [Artemisia annua]